jgi:hypothetical protein
MIQNKMALHEDERGHSQRLKSKLKTSVTDEDGTTFTVKDWAVDELEPNIAQNKV